MEACISNLLEPGDTFVVGDKGIWGERVADIGTRFGGAAHTEARLSCRRQCMPQELHIASLAAACMCK
jgi:aspartate aminotransferase-like enzyme